MTPSAEAGVPLTLGGAVITPGRCCDAARLMAAACVSGRMLGLAVVGVAD